MKKKKKMKTIITMRIMRILKTLTQRWPPTRNIIIAPSVATGLEIITRTRTGEVVSQWDPYTAGKTPESKFGTAFMIRTNEKIS